MGAGIAAIYVGKDIRGDQITEPQTHSPSVLHLFRAANTEDRVLNGAPDATELAVSKDATNPSVKLPVISGTDRAVPAGAALTLIDSQWHAGSGELGIGVGSPDPAAATTEDIEAGPVVSGRDRGRRLLIWTCSQISGRSRCGHCRDRTTASIAFFIGYFPKLAAKKGGCSILGFSVMAVTRSHTTGKQRDGTPCLDEDSKKLFRENNEAIAAYLTEAFAENELIKVLPALRRVLRAQNAPAVAREAGLRRERLYGTFGGEVDPSLGRILKLFNALDLRFTIVPSARRERRPRPKLGGLKKERVVVVVRQDLNRWAGILRGTHGRDGRLSRFDVFRSAPRDDRDVKRLAGNAITNPHAVTKWAGRLAPLAGSVGQRP